MTTMHDHFREEDAQATVAHLCKEHGVRYVNEARSGWEARAMAEMRAVCRSNRGVNSRYYQGTGATLADALADLLGYLERAKQEEGAH